MLNSCTTMKIPYQPDKFYNDKIESKRIIYIDNIVFVDDDLSKIPDSVYNIELSSDVTFTEFLHVLSMQKINILFDNIQFNPDQTIFLSSYIGSLHGLLRSLQELHGFFYKYIDGVIVVKKLSTVYLSVFNQDLVDGFDKILKTFNISNFYYDKLASKIVFEANYYQYKQVYDYFNTVDFSLITVDIMIIEKECSKNEEKGFDVHNFKTVLNAGLNKDKKFEVKGNDISGSFSLLLNLPDFDLFSMFSSLKAFKDFNITQSLSLSVPSGMKNTVDISEKIPYISDVQFASLNNSDNVVQSYDFDNVSAGLIIGISPVFSNNLITLFFESDIKTLVSFLNVGAGDFVISQPVVSTRSVKTNIVVEPGATIILAGMKYSKRVSDQRSLAVDFDYFLKKTSYRNFDLMFLCKTSIIIFKHKGG